MRFLILAGLGLLSAEPVLAQSPFAISSSAESGWTSNATESPDGGGDFYLRHHHEISLAGQAGPLSLRGAVQVEQRAFRHYRGEDDLSLTLLAEAGLALSDRAVLRLGYGLTQEWIGEMAGLGPLMVSIASPARQDEFLAELVVAGAERAGAAGVEILRRQPGPSHFTGLDLPPLRLAAEAGQVRAWLDGEWVMMAGAEGLARLQWRAVTVPEADRWDFGREPASSARLAGGLRLGQGPVSAELRAGLDLVWPQAAPHLLVVLPYGEAELALALTPQLRLDARLLADTEVFNPSDGVASRKLEAELGARLALTANAALTAGLALGREEGLYDPSALSQRRRLSAGLSVQLAPHMEAGLLASHGMIEEPGGSYEVSTLALTLAGKV